MEKEINNLINNIINFINESIKQNKKTNSTRWFENDLIGVSIFIRYTPKRMINNNFISTIDIAAISIIPEYQNKKIFTTILYAIETTFNTIPIYIESVLNDQFEEWLSKQNYKPIYIGGVKTNSLIKFKK